MSSAPAVMLRRSALAALALASCTGAITVGRGPARFTTYVGASTVGAVLTGLAVLTLVLAGLITRGLAGYLALLLAIAWTMPTWAGWPSGPALVPSAAGALAGFTVPLLVHLALTHPQGLRGRLDRGIVLAAYLEAGIAAVVLALVRDPYLDPDCWANCAVNAFLIQPLPGLAQAVQFVDRWLVAAAAVIVVAILAGLLARASAAGRRILSPVGVPAIAYGLAVVARGVALQVVGPEDPLQPALQTIFVIASAAVIALAGGLLWHRVRSRAQRVAVERITARLDRAPAPGALEASLAEILHDPDVRIAYWLDDADCYVDARGVPVPEPVSTARRSATGLLSGQRRIATVSHVTGALQDAGQLGRTVRLSLDNERLQAELLHRLAELRRSRIRIVESADTARQRLERDLHDGAQQGLLALAYDIRLALRSADSATGRQALERALQEAEAAIEELRSLAHGLYPALLAESGLIPALQTLADTAEVPVEVDGDDDRLPHAVEAAAYFAVREGIESAADCGATWTEVSVEQAAQALLLSVLADVSAAPSTAMLDRVGALGGTVLVEPNLLVVEIPCG